MYLESKKVFSITEKQLRLKIRIYMYIYFYFSVIVTFNLILLAQPMAFSKITYFSIFFP